VSTSILIFKYLLQNENANVKLSSKQIKKFSFASHLASRFLHELRNLLAIGWIKKKFVVTLRVDNLCSCCDRCDTREHKFVESRNKQASNSLHQFLFDLFSPDFCLLVYSPSQVVSKQLISLNNVSMEDFSFISRFLLFNINFLLDWIEWKLTFPMELLSRFKENRRDISFLALQHGQIHISFHNVSVSLFSHWFEGAAAVKMRSDLPLCSIFYLFLSWLLLASFMSVDCFCFHQS
jgi:hypothetical protein